jgi:hypothetical protein
MMALLAVADDEALGDPLSFLGFNADWDGVEFDDQDLALLADNFLHSVIPHVRFGGWM